MMKPLSERSLDALRAAKGHLEEIEAQVSKDMEEFPGPGWEPVVDMLVRDRTEIEHELKRRNVA